MAKNEKVKDRDKIRGWTVLLYTGFLSLFCFVFWIYAIFSLIHSVFVDWEGWGNTTGSLLCVLFLPFGGFICFVFFVMSLNTLNIPLQFKIFRLRVDLRMPEQDEDEEKIEAEEKTETGSK